MTTITADPIALAQQLTKRQALDASLPENVRLAAAAEALSRAGSVINPQNRNPRSVLAALATLEGLAGLTPATLQRLWIALRALDLKAGEHLGGALVINPVVGVFAKANGVVPTLAKDDRVGGVIGGLDGRATETLAARARIVEPGLDGIGFEVRTAEQILFSEGDAAAKPEALLKSIDAIATRHAAGTPAAAAKATGPQPLAYNVVEPQPNAAMVGDTLFEAYVPARVQISGAHPHPSPLVESAALASVTPPVPTYKPLLLPEIVSKGLLSDIQLETIIYAGQAHESYLPSDPMDPNATPPRQGFLIGHGTGVGKGRICAGIIADNWAQGRRRAVWISERHRLIKDATRDWIALGGRASDFIDLREIAPDQQIPARNGILFLTYSLLRGEYEKTNAKVTRVDQILEWLGLTSDNVIVFDECQNARNAVSRGQGFIGRTKTSKQGEAVLALQHALPNARVVYASATSASDIGSMGYAVRLGLWGRGTAFPTAQAFFQQMEQGGINALELVARDLKALGLYLAANLSFDGVQYERLEYRLTDAEREVQNKLADAWARVNVSLQQAMLTTGLSTLAKNAGKAQSALFNAQFGMAKSRFFQALLASLKTKPVIEAVRKDLANGHAAVIQLTNTYEANADRALAEAKTGDLSEVEATPKDILLEYVRNQFPVQRYRVQHVGKNVIAVPVTDAHGNPVNCPKAEKERDQLIQEIEQLTMPEGPLEQILAAFGPEAVAEVTGRRRRLVPGILPGSRQLEERTPAQVDEDIRQFQAGSKMILVFSTSGAAGSSYDANRTIPNQALRRHYLLQPGWRADLAIQGLGRTHRSNQKQPPVYVLVTTDLWADRRMISTVASGMQKLGAITRGQRHAASQELFTEEDNLESALASTAWTRFLKDLEAKRVPNLSLAQFEHDTGIVIRKPGTNELVEQVPEVRRFLNAMSGMRCELQAAFGDAYKARLDECRLEAIRSGTYDRGIETLKPESLIKLEDTVIYREPRTGAPTRLLKMMRRDPVTPVSYEEAQRQALRSGNARFVKSALTGRVACLIFPKLLGKMPSDDDKVTIITPTGYRQRRRGDVTRERWALAPSDQCEDMWNAELAQPLESDEQIFYVVSGTLLPLWDKLPKRCKTIVYRMETDEGERILGRTVPEDFVNTLVTRVNALSGQGGIDPTTALEAIEKGNIATLANGWIVEGLRNIVTGEIRVEVNIPEPNPEQYETELTGDGLTANIEPITKRMRFRLPSDPAQRAKAWTALTKHRPVVGVTALFS